MNNKKQNKQLNKAIAKMVVSLPFYSDMALSTPIAPREDIPTAATDGVKIYYNEEWFATLTVPQVMFVLAHEVEHIVRRHALRKGGRWHKRWNAACDHRINNDLLARGLKGPTAEDGSFMGLADLKFKDDSIWNSERIYAHLTEQEQEGEGEGLSQPGTKPEDGEGEGEGEGLSQPGTKQEEGEGVSWEDDIIPHEGTEQEREAAEREVRARIVQAAQIAERKCRGSVPAHLRGIIDDLAAPQVDWRTQVRDFLEVTIGGDESTWSRLNKRVAHRGLKFPTSYSENVGGVAVIIDTSGSCQQAIPVFLGELAAIVSDLEPERLYIRFIDTQIQAKVETTYDDFEADMGDLMTHPPLGGGTDLCPAFEAIEAEDGEVDAVIVLTDMWTPWPSEFAWADRTLFVDVAQGDEAAPFGRKVPYEQR